MHNVMVTSARVVMAMTDRKVKKKLMDDKVDTELDARYVDDGWKWSEATSRIQYMQYMCFRALSA